MEGITALHVDCEKKTATSVLASRSSYSLELARSERFQKCSVQCIQHLSLESRCSVLPSEARCQSGLDNDEGCSSLCQLEPDSKVIPNDEALLHTYSSEATQKGSILSNGELGFVLHCRSDNYTDEQARSG